MALFNFLKARRPIASGRGVEAIRPDDLFIVSYPRSGNTWMRFLLANLLAPHEAITFRNIESHVPDIHKSADTLAERPGRRFFKSHHPSYDSYPQFIYIYRDGRDALVSYYHYATGKKAFEGTFAEFVSSPLASKFGSWRAHVNGAFDFAKSRPDRVLLVQYEQMLAHQTEGAARAAAFAKVKSDEESVAAAVAKSSFAELKAIEEKFGGEELGREGNFFRRGASGQWQEYFTGELYEKFLRENAETLLRLGYSL